MTTTATLPTLAPATITRAQIRELRDIVGYERYAVHPIVSALGEAHPDAEYDPNDGSGAGQILADHFEEALALARTLAQTIAAEAAALETEKDAEKQAQTAGAKFARIRDAIKAGLRKTDHGELATPETYAQAKAAAEAEGEANTLRAEGAKEQRAAAKRLEQSKASAAKHIRENPPQLDTEALEQAVRDAHDAIDRIRAVRDRWVPEFDAAVATLESAGWPQSMAPTGATSWGPGWVQVDGKDYSRTACRVYLAEIRDYIHELR